MKWRTSSGVSSTRSIRTNALDKTFGPSVRFLSIPRGMKPNQPPSAGFQFFGKGSIDGRTRELTVTLHDLSGRRLWSISLPSIEV